MPDWQLTRTIQCGKCPWRVGVDPHDIPNGYDEEKHRALRSTIATPGDLRGALGSPLRVMACHESSEDYCLGWLMHQLGEGNNIALRLRMRSCTNLGAVQLRGPQHACFEDTLP